MLLLLQNVDFFNSYKYYMDIVQDVRGRKIHKINTNKFKIKEKKYYLV
jgi:hypothetical protein